MFKTYSTVTKKFYDSLAEAEAAEEAVKKAATAKEEKVAALNKKLAEIKAKQVKEVTPLQAKVAELNAKIAELDTERTRAAQDIAAINAEATFEIDSCNKELQKLSKCTCTCKGNKSDANDDACTVKVMTFDSSKDNDWQTVIDETCSMKDLLTKLEKSDKSLKDLLKLMDIK